MGYDHYSASFRDTSRFRTYFVLNPVEVVTRVCVCTNYWFEDTEDGWERCEYCGRVRSVQDGKVDADSS